MSDYYVWRNYDAWRLAGPEPPESGGRECPGCGLPEYGEEGESCGELQPCGECEAEYCTVCLTHEGLCGACAKKEEL